MKKLILILFLIINVYGCSLVSPWRAPTSCGDVTGNGAECASVESNLEYSINSDKKDEDVSSSKDNISSDSEYDSKQVTKDELAQLVNDMAIDVSNSSKTPVYIPEKMYKVFIFPYSAGNKFYSARYVYISAGKPRWVMGSYVIDSDNNATKIDLPKQSNNHLKKLSSKNINKVVDRTSSYEVVAYRLNCRDVPSYSGSIVDVLNIGTKLQVIDTSNVEWWQVDYEGISCYVHSSYLGR